MIYSLFNVVLNKKVLAGGQGWLRMSALFTFLMFFPSSPIPEGAAPHLLLSNIWV